jgi:type II secretory pathway component HofQ
MVVRGKSSRMPGGRRRKAMTSRRSSSGGAVEATEVTLRELLADVPNDVRRRVFQEIGVLVEENVHEQRERCVELCRRRAELWRRTSAAKSAVAVAREEARARANEAHYLADLIESGADPSDVGGTPPADA